MAAPLGCLVVAAVVLSGCGDGDDDGSEVLPSESQPSEAQPSESSVPPTTASTGSTDTAAGPVRITSAAEVATALQEADIGCTDFESEDFSDPTTGGIGYGECTVLDLPVEIYVASQFSTLDRFVGTELRSTCAFENTRRLSTEEEALTHYKLVVGFGFVITSKGGTDWAATATEPGTGDADIERIAGALGGDSARVPCPAPDQPTDSAPDQPTDSAPDQ